ncbi:MAG: peptide deformylase [Bacteroidetes bacterium RIFCSPLOWO2_02_FULL_36_8]|nr:MAG: peptide deformylase [Bacteroidetes bacterium RIFCSPLOWO2_02_FULL_36_8]OFY69836.1 MAG: peptide deformylase [Bacteroidetes bacterium RIFCSPLOWO2_12_FULL_37_12]
MIIPILAYGDPILKNVSVDIALDLPDLQTLIDDMFDTMNEAGGVGLAAPQIGKNLRLFITDAEGLEKENIKDFKKVFINPVLLEEEGEKWDFNEGCLSIPGIREDISRKQNLRIKYYDRNGQLLEEVYSGVRARIIQHEMDHLNGVLFTDLISPLKKRLLKSKLLNISLGNVEVSYKMRFPVAARKGNR